MSYTVEVLHDDLDATLTALRRDPHHSMCVLDHAIARTFHAYTVEAGYSLCQINDIYYRMSPNARMLAYAYDNGDDAALRAMLPAHITLEFLPS